ncbi:MAG: thioredoxin reductase (NADPH) [Bacillota bacterium]|nr:MAG: thioredoxin reductase (NADPH) [Bacillota bacterium]
MELLDIAIVGCGPAGLSAAVNAKIRNKVIKVFGAEVCSPKLASAPWIDNYLGFHQITGTELRDLYLAHIEEMGIEIYRTRVDNIVPMDSTFMLAAKTDMFEAKAIIIATGVSQTSYLPGERDFVGRGVSYCGTCDGPLYRSKTVAVVAYTHEGVEEANYLVTVAEKVFFVPQMKDYHGLSSQVEIVNGRPLGVLGEGHVTHLALKDQQLEVAGVFIFRDVTPAEQLLSGLNQFQGAIVVDRSMATNIPGVFAAGDSTGRPFQLAKAVGEGLVAGLSAASYIDKSASIK